MADHGTGRGALSGVLAWVLYGGGWVAIGLALPRQQRGQDWLALGVGGNAAFALADVLDRAWPWAAWNACVIAVLLGWDWWNRKGKRAAKELGTKSAALVAGLVERVRDAGGAVPEGAGA